MVGLYGKLTAAVSQLSLPKMTTEVVIDVFLIHNSNDPEDYFFLVDFERFVEVSRGGAFVRPQLRIWAGRQDFGRLVFARHFRKVFATEFDSMRQELASKNGKRGWLDLNFGLGVASDILGNFIANLFLSIALSVGRRAIGDVSVPSWLKGKSKELKLEDEIDRTKDQVESALLEIKVNLHPELVEHAGQFDRVSGGPEIDRDAWPLPDFVREHIEHNQNASWW